MQLIESSQKIMSLGQRLKRLLPKQIQIHNDIKSPSGNDDSIVHMNDNELESILEIARVEGYGDSSIISELINIKRILSNDELQIAANKISDVLHEVMPFDYQEFFELFKATEDNGSSLSDKDCWVFFGSTGTFPTLPYSHAFV